MFNQKGFSIAQISVAMAMMSIMSVGLSTMIQNQANTVYYLEDKMSHQNFKKEVENLLSDTTVCSESLTNIPLPQSLIQASPTSGTNFIIKNSAGVTLFDPADDSKNKFDNIKITNIKVQNVDVTDPALGGKAIIKVDLARERGTTKQALKSIEIEKSVSIDNNFRVVSCSGDSQSGWGECLENSGGTYLGRTGYSGPNVTQGRVPSSAKAIKLSLPGGTCSGGSANGPNGGNDWDGSLAAAEIVIPLNGKVIINGRALTSGGILSLGGRRGNEIYYMGVHLATLGECSEGGNGHTVLIPSSNLPFCYKTTDYRAPAAYNFGGRWSAANAGISFWD